MVYFINEEERKSIERLTREVDVDEELRGWSYLDGPLRPPYNITLPLYIIASETTFSSRTEYEEYVRRLRTSPSREMLLGLNLHRLLSIIVEESKAFIYRYGPLSGSNLYSYLNIIMEGKIAGLTTDSEMKQYLNRLWIYESLQIAASIDRVLSEGISSKDVLIQKALPFTLEYEVDGKRIGLSERLRVDALGHFMVIFELKTGKMSKYHKLATTGYALALESVLEHPVNVGCLVYLDFEDNITTPLIKRDVHAIDESLRRWFIDERDKKMEILAF